MRVHRGTRVALLDSWVGRKFRHLGDAREGTLAKEPRGFIMQWEERGEALQESVTMQKLMADWTDELGPSKRLLPEEIQKIADISDRTLQACLNHEPYLFHEMPLEKVHDVFDREFHQQIREFLRAKYNDG